MKWMKALSFLGATMLLVGGLAACSPNTAPSTESSGSVSMSVSEAQGEASQAIVLAVKDGTALFADKDNQGVYTPGLPEGQIFGLDGEVIGVDQLKPGNVVEVIGNGIMLESYPGQYPGITRIVVVEEGTPDSVTPYEDVIAQVFAEPDPYEVPAGHVEYVTAQANTTVMLTASSWTWDTADGFRQVQDGSVLDAEGALLPDLADVRVSSSTLASLGFALAPSDVQVTAQVLERAADGAYRLADASAAPVECETDERENGDFRITVEPGNLYTVYAFFDHGNATYDFYVPLP